MPPIATPLFIQKITRWCVHSGVQWLITKATGSQVDMGSHQLGQVIKDRRHRPEAILDSSQGAIPDSSQWAIQDSSQEATPDDSNQEAIPDSNQGAILGSSQEAIQRLDNSHQVDFFKI